MDQDRYYIFIKHIVLVCLYQTYMMYNVYVYIKYIGCTIRSVEHDRYYILIKHIVLLRRY